MNARDAVADADDLADFVHRDGLLVVRDLLAEKLSNLVCLDIGHTCSYSEARRSRNRSSWLRTDPSYIVEPTRTTAPPSSAESVA